MVHRLFGRGRELSVLSELVARAAGGRGGALIVRGEPGIGKSALLTAATAKARARGLRTWVATGVQAEARLAFAGLHQLLRPILHLADALPDRQRAALLGGFGRSEQTAPELFLIALATLELISDAAARVPVLILLEDAQWLDQPTAAALAFVARRLAAEPVALCVALRDGHDSPFDGADLPELRLERLDERAAEALLSSRAGEIGHDARTRLLSAAVGNPLALVELPAALDSQRAEQEAPELLHLPLTTRLERAFAAQQSALPAATRALLLVAAADDGDKLAEMLPAAGILHGAEVRTGALTPAVEARLITADRGWVRFRHPLARSAIYQAASLAQRQAAHAALAEVLAGRPERQVWHQAGACVGPDEELARGLDQAAVRAEDRGAVAVAISAVERAAELSADPARRGARLTRAAEMAFELGRQESGLRLLRDAEALAPAAPERARLSLIRETYHDAARSGADAWVSLTAELPLDDQPELALKLLHTIAVRLWWGTPDDETRSAVVAAAERVRVPQDEPALLAVLAHADPVGRGAVVLRRIAKLTPDALGPAGMHLAGTAANAVWAYDQALRFLDPAVDGLRGHGRLGLLAQALVAQSWALVHLAREPPAVSAAEEAWHLARETGQPRWAASARLAQATIAAERGCFDEVEALIGEAERLLLTSGAAPQLALAQFVRGRAAVAHHRYAEGIEHHRRVLDPGDPAHHPIIGAWGLPDLVEAAAHTGARAAATSYLARLESLAAATSGSLLRAGAAFARPMVAADTEAEKLFRAALGDDLRDWPCYRGRLLLLYGRWLRRQRRVTESRGPLRAALEGFEALAFPLLADQARQELRASGESSHGRQSDAWHDLTPQELQIARLGADGLSNREIGQRLYISHRTVGYHLHRIFPKLGITSRSQLHAAMGGPGGAHHAGSS